MLLIGPNLNNGGFELPALAANGKVADGFDDPANDCPNWNNTGGTTNDVGFENGPAGAGGSAQFAYWHAGQTGAFNLTTTVIHAGDQFNVSWFGAQDSLRVQLIGSPDGTYGTATVLATIDQVQSNAGNNFAQFSLPTYTATANDAGLLVGLAVFDAGTSYANGDDFTLAVTPVPEPGTYALMFAGLGGLLVFRARRAAV